MARHVRMQQNRHLNVVMYQAVRRIRHILMYQAHHIMQQIKETDAGLCIPHELRAVRKIRTRHIVQQVLRTDHRQ